MTNQFASIDLCKKFVEMGMKSESGLFMMNPEGLRWTLQTDYRCSNEFDCWETVKGLVTIHHYPAFHPWDIIANTEQARKNAEILWPSVIVAGIPFMFDQEMNDGEWCIVRSKTKNMIYPFEYHRHKAIDQPADKFWDYIKETMK